MFLRTDVIGRFVSGDNILTAISVARQCCMIAAGDTVVVATAHPPADGRPAAISWRTADVQDGDEPPAAVPMGATVATEATEATEVTERCTLKRGRTDELLVRDAARRLGAGRPRWRRGL